MPTASASSSHVTLGAHRPNHVHQGRRALPQLHRPVSSLPVRGQPADEADHRPSVARLQHMRCLQGLSATRGEDQEDHRRHVTERMHRPRHPRIGGQDAGKSFDEICKIIYRLENSSTKPTKDTSQQRHKQRHQRTRLQRKGPKRRRWTRRRRRTRRRKLQNATCRLAQQTNQQARLGQLPRHPIGLLRHLRKEGAHGLRLQSFPRRTRVGQAPEGPQSDPSSESRQRPRRLRRRMRWQSRRRRRWRNRTAKRVATAAAIVSR